MEENIQNDTQENISSPPIVEEPQTTTPRPTSSYDLSALSQDAVSARIISPAYSSRCSELAAILQYVYYATVLENLGYTDISRQLLEIGEAEMHHLRLLAQTLIRLGVDPIYTAFPPKRDAYFTTRYINYLTDPKTIIRSAICDEQCAIKQYDRMLDRLTNATVIDIIRHIRNAEQGHLETLNNILTTL